MGATTNGFRELRAMLESLDDRADDEFEAVVNKGALNVKTDWRALWTSIKRPATHIPHLVAGIGYDEDHRSPRFSATVGVLASNRQAFLAHILEYGSVTNPPYPGGQAALDEEAPRFAAAAEAAGERLLTDG